MDEQFNNMTPEGTSSPEPVTPQPENIQPEITPQENAVPQQEPAAPVQEPPVQASTANVQYAGFLTRFLAAIIDFIVLMVLLIPLGIVYGILLGGGSPDLDGGNSLASPLNLVAWAYYVIMTVKYGATVGKMVMGIRVQKETTGENLTWVDAILREVIGKFLSGVVLFLGYLWMLWDPKKQTWHDKIGKSIVVKK